MESDKEERVLFNKFFLTKVEEMIKKVRKRRDEVCALLDEDCKEMIASIPKELIDMPLAELKISELHKPQQTKENMPPSMIFKTAEKTKHAFHAAHHLTGSQGAKITKPSSSWDKSKHRFLEKKEGHPHMDKTHSVEKSFVKSSLKEPWK